VESGANPLLSTKENTTALMVAAGLGNFEDPSEEQQKNALEAAKMLVQLGVDVNAVGENGWTALHGAAYTGADAIAQFLIEKGAKLNVKDVFEQTPLSIAQGLIGVKVLDFTKKPFGPHPSTAKLLLRLGSDPNVARVIERTEAEPAATRSNQ
jgi:ankyrin repeat protein